MPILIAILLAAGLSGCVAYAETTRFEYRIPPADEVVVYDDEADARPVARKPYRHGEAEGVRR